MTGLNLASWHVPIKVATMRVLNLKWTFMLQNAKKGLKRLNKET